ncbi:MAG: glutathione S-transferase family protein [Thermaurantiacus sp.]
MKLYGGLLSPFVMRAALVARMKGHDIPVEMPAEGIKSEAYLRLNPFGKMPTLVDGDFALPESAVIAEYLDEVLEGPKLLPSDPRVRARARLMARVADLYVAPALTPVFRAREAPDAVPAALDSLRTILGQLESLRPAGAPHAAGDSFTIADATLMPVFFFLDAFDGPFGTARILADAAPGLAAWWTEAKRTPEGARMVSEMASALAAFMGNRS